MNKSVLKFSSACIIAATMILGSCTNETSKTAESTAPAFNLDSVKTLIVASNKAYGESFSKGDSAAFVSSYTADACLNAPNMPALCGPKAITGFFNGGYQMGIRNIKLTVEDVLGSKDAVVETGKYEVLGDKDASFDKGKYIVIWKEENGKWKMYRDIFNSDMPAKK